jgi:hypothetical protein
LRGRKKVFEKGIRKERETEHSLHNAQKSGQGTTHEHSKHKLCVTESIPAALITMQYLEYPSALLRRKLRSSTIKRLSSTTLTGTMATNPSSLRYKNLTKH